MKEDSERPKPNSNILLPAESGRPHPTHDIGPGIVVCQEWRYVTMLDREDGPAILWKNAETGRAIAEFWLLKNRRHRDEGPAMVWYDAATGDIVRQEWWKNGVHVNANGQRVNEDTEDWFYPFDMPSDPSVTSRVVTEGQSIWEEWWTDRTLGRHGGPTLTMTDLETGVIRREEWWLNGRLHHETGPALIFRDSETNEVLIEEWRINGNLVQPFSNPGAELKKVIGIRCQRYPETDDHPTLIGIDVVSKKPVLEHWKKNGVFHRVDGPAFISYDSETGVLDREEWFLNGERHRLGAPAVIWRDPRTGHAEKQEWWLHGVSQDVRA